MSYKLNYKEKHQLISATISMNLSSNLYLSSNSAPIANGCNLMTTGVENCIKKRVINQNGIVTISQLMAYHNNKSEILIVQKSTKNRNIESIVNIGNQDCISV